MALSEQDKAAATAKKQAGTKIGFMEIGANRFDLLASLHYMIAEYGQSLAVDRVRPAYRSLTKDMRDDVDWQKAKAVVLGEIQMGWYRLHKKAIPQGVVAAQDERLKEALMSSAMTTANGETKGTTKAKKTKGPTVGGLIRRGLLANWSKETILKHVKDDFPKSKAGEKDIAYYMYHLRKEGALAPVDRSAKPPKTASAKVKKAAAVKKPKKTATKKTATKKKASE